MKKRLFCLLLAAALTACVLAPGALAADLGYVTDNASLLSEREAAALTETAGRIEEQYACGVYILTVDDFTDYYSGSSIYDFGVEVYQTYGLGVGEEQDGLLLVLSMEERDFAMVVKGTLGNSAFGSRSQQSDLQDAFLDEFRQDDWYGGFADWLEESEYLVARAAAGDPVTDGQVNSDATYYGGSQPQSKVTPLRVGIVLVVPALIALIACLSMKSKMKSATERTDADEYMVANSLNLTAQRDQFINTTIVRTPIQTQSSSGPRSGGGGGGGSSGFSGSSGKF